MSITAIKNAKLVLPDRVTHDLVLSFDKRILSIGERAEAQQWLDAQGYYLCPGFIDIHVHGGGGADTMDATPATLAAMAGEVAKSGVTAFVPTTVSMDEPDTMRALDNIRNYMANPQPGAKVLGAHLEGPFLNPAYKGAHSSTCLRTPSNQFSSWKDIIRIITLAPELDDNFVVTSQAVASGITVSMGHTAATYSQAMSAFAAGITSVTHLFNAMTGLHHREPGAVGAALDSGVWLEIIADNIHIHPAIYRMLLNEIDRLVLVTDGIRATGLTPGRYELGGQEVLVDESSARLGDGTLAGSILTMDRAVANFVQHTGINLVKAVAMASTNPAKLLGVAMERGSLVPGLAADFVLLDDNLMAAATIIGGEIYYNENFALSLC